MSAPLPLTAVQVADADFLRAKRKRAGLRTAPKASWKRGVKRQLRGGRLKFTPAREPSRGGTNKEVQGWGLGFGVKVGNHRVRPHASASPLLLRCPPEPSDAGGSCCPGRTSRRWGCSCGYLGGVDASQGSSRQRERPGTQNRQWGLCQPSQVAQEHVLLAKPCFFWLLSSASNREGHGWAKGTPPARGTGWGLGKGDSGQQGATLPWLPAPPAALLLLTAALQHVETRSLAVEELSRFCSRVRGRLRAG